MIGLALFTRSLMSQLHIPGIFSWKVIFLAFFLLPWLIANDSGDGNTDKGFKSEWATVKDGKLVVGSFGKEFTDSKGHIVNTNNNWVKVISNSGRYVPR